MKIQSSPNKTIEKDISVEKNDSLSYNEPTRSGFEVSSLGPNLAGYDASSAASVAIQIGPPVIKEFRTHLTRFLAKGEVRCPRFIDAGRRSGYKY
jgi:hypothetical protein